MSSQERMTMITESTFDPYMRRTMERLEGLMREGQRTVEVDIYEMLHIIGKQVGLANDVKTLQEMLYRTFKGYSDHYNLSVNRNVMMDIPASSPAPSTPVETTPTAGG